MPGSVLDQFGPSVRPPAALPPTAPETMRAFGNAAATRSLIYDNALKAMQEFEPVSNQRYTLGLRNVGYADPDVRTIAERKNAILKGKSLARRLRGTWTLADAVTGKMVSEKEATLAAVPHLTDNGTFVQSGTEYTLANQLRLRSGVYVREQDNGDLEAHINTLPGKGLSHRIYLDPKTGVFRIRMQQAQIPLLPVLRAMGVLDGQMRAAWGNDLMAANIQHDDPKAVNKLYEKLVRQRDPDAPPAVRQQAIAEAFEKMELDPEVTAKTLGKPYDRLNTDAIMAITDKLLRVNRGEAEQDDRDNLAYQTLHGPEDMIAERLSRSKMLAHKLLWKATAKGNLDHVSSGLFNGAIQSAILDSGLGSPLEEINPAELLDQQSRVTRMGVGGIPSLDAVPDSARNVQPSQLGFIDFLRTPDSGNAGVDQRLARNAYKGRDGKLYMPVLNKQGALVYKSAQEINDGTLAFPEALKSKATHVPAIANGRISVVSREDVDYTLPAMEDTFSPLGNLVPMKSTAKGQRAVMAARMITQALPLMAAEAPLVQSGVPGKPDRSFEEEYSPHMGALFADAPGTVTKVSPDAITIRRGDGTTKDYELYNQFPFARKTFLHQTPTVQPGATVQPGQLLARSNYTDVAGTTALGVNARVAYIPWKGWNFEDAIVVSEDFAKNKGVSEHMYQHGIDWEPQHKTGKHAFVSLFPSAYTRKQLDNFTSDGVIKPGTVVQPDDPLILVARERERTQKALNRGKAASHANDTITWEHKAPGVVTDVSATDGGVAVVVKTQAQLAVGDKLSGRCGDKGIISAIVPTAQMPVGEDGNPFEVLLNPLGLISRVNPAQIIEAALGKIAAKTGKPYKIQDFGDIEDLTQFAIDELAKHGMKDTEDVTDPETGRKIRGIMTGNRFMMKLKQTAADYGQGRGLGAYTSEGLPAKGGDQGAKRVGMMELNSLLSHGATENIRDIKLHRGQAHPDYWLQFMSGHKPTTPKVPDVYTKFVNELKASGINVVREGPRTHIMAMTDQGIDRLVGNRELQNTETVDWQTNLRPVRGGLFDPALTGGHNGQLWAKITLHEPLPNPVMEEPIRRVLGLTAREFEDVLSGRSELNGARGPKAIQQALAAINLDREIERAQLDFRSNRKTARDDAARKLGYLKDTKRLGIHPKDWVISKVPVLPPAFRPVSIMSAKKLPLVSDPNYLYKELFDANNLQREMAGQIDDTAEERLTTYRALKAVTGLGDPIHPKNQERQVKGILRHVFGPSPKLGTVQRRLLGASTDLVGRSVIAPNPNLDMDQVALPEDRAWDVYRPFIIRSLVRRGMPRIQAARAAEERSADARKALLAEMEARPVIINRAPTLHRYGIMAFWPTLTKTNTLQVSPIIVGGFGADFDGDAMQYHVPATDEAAREAAEKMLPSRNLFSAATFGAMYKPVNEYLGGLYEASARVDTKNKPAVFATAADAMRAYRQGKIDVDRRVEILNYK